mmetsp:Transcript_15355/g.29962  ORF Transcript_15355/g.29962 Transcript_15355/m.29962 type:complete len:175 (-) Transcript_15355:620-1144(-)
MGRGKRVEHVLCDFPEPTADQCVVRVTAINGGNLVSASDANGMSYLCRIPAKYHNVFWVKIGGYLIVDKLPDASNDENAQKLHSTVQHFLFRDQIRNLQNKSLWPAQFEEIEGKAGRDDDMLRRNPNHRIGGDSEEEGESEKDDDSSEGDFGSGDGGQEHAMHEAATDAAGNSV